MLKAGLPVFSYNGYCNVEANIRVQLVVHCSRNLQYSLVAHQKLTSSLYCSMGFHLIRFPIQLGSLHRPHAVPRVGIRFRMPWALLSIERAIFIAFGIALSYLEVSTADIVI